MKNHSDKAVMIYFGVFLVVVCSNLYVRVTFIDLGYMFVLIVCFLRVLCVTKGSR